METLGRLLQLVGLFGVAYGFAVGVLFHGALMDELMHAAIGIAVFSIGSGLLRFAVRR